MYSERIKDLTRRGLNTALVVALTLAPGCATAEQSTAKGNPRIPINNTPELNCTQAGIFARAIPPTLVETIPEGRVVYYGVRGPSLKQPEIGRLMPDGVVIVQLNSNLSTDQPPSTRRLKTPDNSTEISLKIDKEPNYIDYEGRIDFNLNGGPLSASWNRRLEVSNVISVLPVCQVLRTYVQNGNIDPIKGVEIKIIDPQGNQAV